MSIKQFFSILKCSALSTLYKYYEHNKTQTSLNCGNDSYLCMEKKCGEWYPNTAKTSFFKFHYRQRSSGWRRYFVVLDISSTSNWCDRAIHVSCQRLMRDFASTVFAAECSEVKSGVAPQDGTKSGAIHDSMINLCLALWTGCHRLFLGLEKEANLCPNVTNQTLSRWTLRSAQAISGREVLVLPLSFLLFL